MRQISGYATIVDPDAPLIERDTITCGHCQRVVFTKPGTAATVYLILNRQTLTYTEESGAFCRTCMRPICLPCCDQGHCLVWERRLEASEARDRLRRAVGV